MLVSELLHLEEFAFAEMTLMLLTDIFRKLQHSILYLVSFPKYYNLLMNNKIVTASNS